MSLEFPAEPRKIGDFYVDAWDGRMVEYHSFREDFNPIDLGEAIKDGLQNCGISFIDTSEANSYMAAGYCFEDSDIGFRVSIRRYVDTRISVYALEKKTADWRIKFKERLADLEKILESVSTPAQIII